MEQVTAAVEMCRQAGVAAYASFILGLPGETEESIQQTLQFGETLKQMGLMFGFHLLAPFPGTEIRERHAAYGIRILSHDWADYHANRAIVETEGVGQSRLNDLITAWEDEFNSHLADIGEKMANGTATREEADQLIGLERTVMIYELMMDGVLERHGSWKQNGRALSRTEAIEELTERISSIRRMDRQKLVDAVTMAVEKRNLAREIQGDRVRWKWVDHL